MLSEIGLDDELFSEILERARARIKDMAPFWTDHNLHDPGITILELFAWMKEMQQFHMDQIGEAHISAYLRLMGIRPRKKKPAEAVVRISGVTQPVLYPQGSRFLAGEVCFEAVSPVRIGVEEITRLSAGFRGEKERQAGAGAGRKKGNGERAISVDLSRRNQDGQGDIRFPAFGEHPQRGSAMRMELSGALKPKVTHCLSIRIFEDGEIKRNPIGDGDRFYPLAELSVRYRGAMGECAAKIVEDTTNGLLQNGMLCFYLEQEMLQENGAYALWLVLERCEYDVPPVLAGISLHEQNLMQQRTLAEYHDGQLRGSGPIRLSTYLAMTGDFLLFRREGGHFVLYDGTVEKKIGDDAAFFFLNDRAPEEMAYRLICFEKGKKGELFLGEGNGLPDQEYRPQTADLCADGMCLMMETIKGSGRYVSASHCDDLMQAGASEAVFCFEEGSGRIRFGDCEHGAAPEGRMIIAAARSCLGLLGNVKERSILGMEGNPQGMVVENKYPAAGGRDAETIAQSSERLRQESLQVTRAVTDEDYERLVLHTPGLMIESARVLSPKEDRSHGGAAREECVTIAVKPVQTGETAPLSEAYRRNILRTLEPKRMLGTRVIVLSPEYIGISVYAEIMAAGEVGAVRKAVMEAAECFFQELRAAFGVTVRASTIYGMLHVLDGVTEVVSLTLDAQGKDIRRTQNGDLILPANGLPCLKSCVLSISSAG